MMCSLRKASGARASYTYEITMYAVEVAEVVVNLKLE